MNKLFLLAFRTFELDDELGKIIRSGRYDLMGPGTSDNANRRWDEW
ncbi:MAG: hypothetical protein WBZ36_23840 [Candidatus Nitrosopolaris sp.]